MSRRTRTIRCTALTLILCAVALLETGTSLARDMRRKDEFRRAAAAAKRMNMQLVVVGDPHQGGWNTAFGASYGCGDVCLDLTGCPKCRAGSKEDLLRYFSRQPERSIVVFESCVMESIPRRERRRIQREMDRAAASLHQVRIGSTLLLRHLYLPRLWTREPQMQSDWR